MTSGTLIPSPTAPSVIRWDVTDVHPTSQQGQPTLLPGWRTWPIRIVLAAVHDTDLSQAREWVRRNIGPVVSHGWEPSDVPEHDCPDCCCQAGPQAWFDVHVPATSADRAVSAVCAVPLPTTRLELPPRGASWQEVP